MSKKMKNENLKYCKDCDRWLPLSEFYYNSHHNKYEWVCKECFKKRLYKNKERRKETFKRWYERLKLDKERFKAHINSIIERRKVRLEEKVKETENKVLNDIKNILLKRR